MVFPLSVCYKKPKELAILQCCNVFQHGRNNTQGERVSCRSFSAILAAGPMGVELLSKLMCFRDYT